MRKTVKSEMQYQFFQKGKGRTKKFWLATCIFSQIFFSIIHNEILGPKRLEEKKYQPI